MSKPIKFIPANRKLIQTKFGLNLRYDTISTITPRIPLLQQLQAQLLYYFTLNASNPQDTARLQQAKDAATQLGLPIGVLYALETPDINKGFPVWLDDLVRILNPAFYGGGAETVSVTQFPQITNAQLISLTEAGIAHTPGINWIWDGALIQRESGTPTKPNVDMLRNLAIAAVSGYKEIRQYLQL